MRRWRIVYFDDQIDLIDCMKDVLADRFNLEGTTDLSQFETHLVTNPDLILIDVHMPVMSGYELYYKIQKSSFYNDCPIMFISGDVSPENELKSHMLGADDFLPRSLELSELSARLVNKIKLHRRNSLKITVENLSLDLELFCIFLNEQRISLTLNELKILGVILRLFPKTFTKEHLIEKIWGDEPIKPGNVNAHLSVLNSKLKDWPYEIKCKKDQILVVKKVY